MDTGVSEDTVPRTLRRSTRRQSMGRTSLGKKKRLEEEESLFGSGDKKEMELQESAALEEEDEDQAMDIEEDFVGSPHQPKVALGSLGDVNLSPFVVLGERCCLSENTDNPLMKPNDVKASSTKETASYKKPSAPTRASETIHNVQSRKITSLAEYKKEMEAKAKRVDISRVNHHSDPSVHAPSVPSYTLRHRANNIPTEKEPVPHKKKEMNQTQRVARKCARGSSRGCGHYFCWSLVILLLLSSAVLLLFKDKLMSQYEGARRPSRSMRLEPFTELLSQLEARFRSQRPELWKRSKIHLEKHLKSVEPTEPVSLILTSGRGAEKTLSCLAEGLASAYSSALAASVLQIDGAAKAGVESDEVKLDVDGQLRAAFDGNQTAAVIHRLEELPPGSTLLFYRYCDHEHAAYKEVFLLFTVLLPREEVSGELGAVEEAVQDYLKDRLVGTSNRMAFNEMDTDKFSGLWSRISHLVLPVVAEEEVEKNGC
ncbi:torsin-1A-interacting protein 2-like isoform X2 [Festucalex cinctus]